MKSKEMIKKGDKVYIYTNDTRNPNYEATVKSVGRKFITTDGPRWLNKFLKDSLNCEQWCAYYLFPGTKEEFEAHEKSEEERHEIIREVSKTIKYFSLEKLNDLRNYINQLK